MPETYKKIADAPLWSGRLHFDPTIPRTAAEMQDEITSYVTDTGITVIAYFVRNAMGRQDLTLQHWPDPRPEYVVPGVEDCAVSLVQMAQRLGASSVEEGIVPDGILHTFMGRKMDGYTGKVVAPMAALDLPGDHFAYTAQEAEMVSARAKRDGSVEPYDEEGAELLVDVSREDIIHLLGNRLAQWHYAIGCTATGLTRFYQTHHFKESEEPAT